MFDYLGNPVDGNILFDGNMTMDYAFDSTSGTNYTALRIFKRRRDGTNQYPFVRKVPSQTYSALDLGVAEGWELVINAGMGQGIVIENGVVITDESAVKHAGAMPLTIDGSGDLWYAEADTTGKGAQMVTDGIVSAVCGFFPIIVNFEDYDYPKDIPETIELPGWVHAQRQIIGQYGNGDYAILTCDGRNFNNSTGWSIEEAQSICKELGIKFAYNLDGGGSTGVVLRKKQLNLIYEGTTGRKMPTFIVFNGTTQFGIPD